ncbi:sensor histidine kinase [Hellea balneolensis]|uniref:sensor histidine kinase n=1 Tax=Hellea balneolensis TaxID=287478 RepID=UPI0003F647C3|nr:HAMP domain-containing sensor histidine kinase [Hellea balneolensis]
MIEAIKKLSRNTLFRLSLLGAFLFVASLLVVAASIYYSTVTSELRRVDRVVESEHAEFQKIFDEQGFQAVQREVTLRTASSEGWYALLNDRVAIGNLVFQTVTKDGSDLPLLSGVEPGTFKKVPFVYSNPESEEEDFQDRRGRALVGPIKTDNGVVAILIVGRDVEAIMRTGVKVRNAILTSSVIALLLGLISSWYVSLRFTRRVEAFNKLADDVRSGNLDRRAPRTYSEDEMDLLAEHLNAMLDHIDRLMKAMRYAGDSVAHDLRTPLTRLRTRLESAAIDLGDTPEADTLFAAAEDASELLQTFDGVLRIARLEAGERRELLADVDPKPMLDDLAELYEPACEDAGLDFSADISSGVMVLADRGLLSQAVSNLIENAIKYTPKGGKIHLSLSKNKSGRAEISITDDGPGIPAEDRERVKERFVRLDKSRTLPGSGLGLALVDAVADLHRAEFVMGAGLGLTDENPGLKATLLLPRRKALKAKN